MALDDQKLEEQLGELGKKLSQLPTQVDELLPLLDKAGSLLAKVEQSPTSSIEKAYSQCMEVLLDEALLRHTDVDVQVAVAFCFNEFLRISAPVAPYDDNQMKEVFQLIVSSFKNLSDMSSRSYKKCATILENVAKVRSGILMLDLECNGLISEMFQHFLSSIRDFHPERIFKWMESVMTLVLEDNDDDSLSLELLTRILASLKRNNEEISSRARKLAETVLANCGVNLKPCLKQAVNSLGLPLDGYSEIVATICKESNSEVEQPHNDGDVSAQKEKPEAPEMGRRLFGHDIEIAVMDKNDLAAVETGMPASKCRIDLTTEIIPTQTIFSEKATQFDYIASGDGAPVTLTKPQSQSQAPISKGETILENDNAGAANENAMPVSQRIRHLTTEDFVFEIDDNTFGDNAPEPGMKSQNTTSKRENDDEHLPELEGTTDILAAAADETTMPLSKRRRYPTIKDTQTQTNDSAVGHNAPESGTKPNSERTPQSKNGDEQSSKLAESIGVLAGALNDMVESKKLPIPVEELWGFLHEMKLDGDLAGDAFVFLLDRPLQLKGLMSTPACIRRSILVKMMMRDAK